MQIVKRSLTRDFQLFHKSFSPMVLNTLQETFRIFTKILEYIGMVIGPRRTHEKVFAAERVFIFCLKVIVLHNTLIECILPKRSRCRQTDIHLTVLSPV